MWSLNSTGAAPVPPSAPSTTMKSGMMLVSSMALAMPINSQGWPMHSLEPTGLPPLSSRSWRMNSISSRGVEKALCRGGDTQSRSMGMPRARSEERRVGKEGREGGARERKREKRNRQEEVQTDRYEERNIKCE